MKEQKLRQLIREIIEAETKNEVSLRGLMGRDMTGEEVARDPKKFRKVVDKIANAMFQLHKTKLRPDDFSAVDKLPGVGDLTVGMGTRALGLGSLPKEWKKTYSNDVERWLKGGVEVTGALEEFPDRDYSDPEEIKMAAEEVLYARQEDAEGLANPETHDYMLNPGPPMPDSEFFGKNRT